MTIFYVCYIACHQKWNWKYGAVAYFKVPIYNIKPVSDFDTEVTNIHYGEDGFNISFYLASSKLIWSVLNLPFFMRLLILSDKCCSMVVLEGFYVTPENPNLMSYEFYGTYLPIFYLKGISLVIFSNIKWNWLTFYSSACNYTTWIWLPCVELQLLFWQLDYFALDMKCGLVQVIIWCNNCHLLKPSVKYFAPYSFILSINCLKCTKFDFSKIIL